MPIYVKAGGTLRQFPTTGGRLLYAKLGGVLRQLVDVQVVSGGAARNEPEYTQTLTQPTNVRMNPANAANHTTLPVAWDYNGALTPDDFYVLLANEWDQGFAANIVAGDVRSTSFNVGQNTKFRVYVYARRAGFPDQRGGPLQWFSGLDPQPYNVPVSDWTNEQYYTPPSVGSAFQNCSSYASGHEPQYTPENCVRGMIFNGQNDGKYWMSANMPETPLTTPSGEGMRFGFPPGHYRLRGIRVLTPTPHDVWYGVYWQGAWFGGVGNPYSGKYGLYTHTYYKASSNTADTGNNLLCDAGHYFITDAYPSGAIDVLYQRPQQWAGDASGNRTGAWSVMLVLQTYGVVRNDTAYTAAINAGYW